MHAQQTFTIGRTENNTYRIDDSSVSDTHLLVSPLSGSEYLLRRLSDAPDGLIIDRQAVRLAKVDRFTPLRLGKVRTTLGEIMKNADQISAESRSLFSAYVKDYQLKPGETYMAGASDVCEVVLPAPRVAWHALKLIPGSDDSWRIQTVHGRNKTEARAGDTLKAGLYRLQFGKAGQLHVHIAKEDRLVIRNLDVRHPASRCQFLIHSLSLAVRAGEFMGIIGPSGAGKSTLLKAIRNIIPIQNGSIALSGMDTGKHPEVLDDIGFVPQDDVVIPELSVEENLYYAASLRLPADWPDAARTTKVDELLQGMRLEEHRHNLCTNISGGQRKRVNLALELMLEPSFLLADEVCSGLSALDTDNILQHLRRIADTGKGVLLTIHSPDIEALDLMDTLLVLDVGGVIAYYGPASDALPYFSSTQGSSPYKSPKLIFDVLEKSQAGRRLISPEEWRENYRNSPYYHTYIEAGLAEENNL
ncbi:MAG: ATP-binding cassette domain-containing protein [Gammaproteobacteria bacterium]|nr:ATP-binding cassette domain-containing protein [Gammaproteobacteria bacterium]